MPRPPAQAGHSGSPSKGEPVYLVVGSLRRPHGVDGEILMEVLTDFPERIQAGMTVFLGGKHHPATISQVRNHNNGLLLSFEGMDSPESVGRFRNQPVYVPTVGRPELPKGNELGLLTDILETGANDVYVVTSNEGHEILLPAIKDVVLNVDLPTKKMTVHIIPGLIDQEE
jgi:16S rRNA processing protein RimM